MGLFSLYAFCVCFTFMSYLLDLYSRWAAYVAGAFLVLMTELGVRFEDSISMLV